MWLLMLEAAVALSLFLFILWWTLAPIKKQEDEDERLSQIESASPPDTGRTP